MTLFDGFSDDDLMAPVANAIRPQGLVGESKTRPQELVGELTQQEVGDAGELQFGSAIVERHGVWQKASTDAQPHDCFVCFVGEWTRVQVKSSQTQQSGGFYAINLGRHRIGVQVFAVMIRHENVWIAPLIIPAGIVRTRRYIRVWPTKAYRRVRRGEFNADQWRGAWWVLDPAERNDTQRDVLNRYVPVGG